MIRSLLVCPIYAASLRTGGGQRTFHLYRALARLGSVDMVLVMDSTCSNADDLLRTIRVDYPEAGSLTALRSTDQYAFMAAAEAGPMARMGSIASRLLQALRPRAGLYKPSAEAAAGLRALIASAGYAVIVGRYLQTTALAGAFEQSVLPVVVDLDDLEELTAQSRAHSPTTSLPRRWLYAHHARQVRRVARLLRARCRHVFIASEADLNFVDHLSRSVLPNIPMATEGETDLTRPRPDAGGAALLFVGSHVHEANRAGIRHFVSRCWPAIRRRSPTARLRVVGSGDWQAERASLRSADGVDIATNVPSLGGEYAAATLCICPIFEGAGTKIKVLEALMHGRVVLAAGYSARGYEQLVGQGLVAAEDDEQMVEECLRLLSDPPRRIAMSLVGHRLVSEHYSFDAFFAALRDGLLQARISFAGV